MNDVHIHYSEEGRISTESLRNMVVDGKRSDFKIETQRREMSNRQ